MNPQLDSAGLKDNGGPTQTIALQVGSPAIDAIPFALCTDQATPPRRLKNDQRGFPRPDPADGRKVLIFISEHGRAVNERLNRLANLHQAGIVEGYGDRATEELKRLLEELILRTA